MELYTGQKQITDDEKIQINQQVKADLIDHLYQGCMPGTISGVFLSIGIFFDFYGHTPTHYLIAWTVLFNLMMVGLSACYFFYKKSKNKYPLTFWESIYSAMMCGCAASWVPVIFLLPDNTVRQNVALLLLFMVTTGYATGTIGVFKLCVATLNIILLPLIGWCLAKGGIFYNVFAGFSAIYMAFMIGINRRSTTWFIDSIKLKLENTLVSYQANHDLLTDLPNQRLLPQFLEETIKSLKNTNQTFVLVAFSLNRMEMINDSLGQQAGDYIIQSVATRLNTLAMQVGRTKEQIKYIITISRKDTFNIIISPLHEDEILERINTLFSVLDEPFYLDEKGVKMTASLGTSIYMRDGRDVQSLITNADAAMLQAKQFGGNKLEFYRAEINAQLPKQLELESDLHDALKNKQLQVYYQPLVDLRTGKIAGSEALLRWQHPRHGFISPVNFIPLAEETGLIVPIGAWVLEEACRQNRLWQLMGYSNLKIAVNVTEKQWQQGLLETVKRVLETTGLDARYLELELTETAILDEKIMAEIKEFKKLGLSLAVDDFGTGYSGLSYLKRFEIDKLKIDQSFIRDLPSNENSITIVSAILAMAKELKVRSLAEGIETVEQLNFLKAKGCDYGQGYYFSKPVEPSLFTQLLINSTKVEEAKEETT